MPFGMVGTSGLRFWFPCHDSHDSFSKRKLSVAAYQPHSKPYVPQHFSNLRPWIKLLGVAFLVPTIGVTDLAKGHDAAYQQLFGNVLVDFHQSGPVIPFHKPLLDSLASTGCRHIEYQKSIRRQSVEHSLAHSPQRPQ